MRTHAWCRTAGRVREWNVVVTVDGPHYAEVKRALRDIGRVGKTEFYNVLVLRVEDPLAALDQLQAWRAETPEAGEWVAHFIPLTQLFNFHSPEAFEAGVLAAAQELAPALAGKTFHVRGHRRGVRHRGGARQEEAFVGSALVDALEAAGTPGRIRFDDPDAVVAVEVVGQRAGLSVWTREAIHRYPELGLERGAEPAEENTGTGPGPGRRGNGPPRPRRHPRGPRVVSRT